jgi:hypothetical protein
MVLKVEMNDNLNLVWYVVPVVSNNTLYYFVSSVVVPLSNENLFVYNLY